MSHFTSEDEALLQSMLRQLLQSVKEKITGAPSVECAEEILLHLEETDENFHNYEFVKYLRQYINNTVGSVIEEETEKCTSAQNQGEVSGYDTLVQHVTKKTRESKEYREMMHALKNVMMVVVESLINKFEEDRMRNKELDGKTKNKRQSGYYTDNCSDSDSSFNQSYAFMSQEQLQLLAERLDPVQPKEVRQEALQTLCFAPPSDILNSECWPNLRKHLMMSLSDPDATFSEKILRFYAKTFSSSPFNMTREVYTSLARHLELYFLSGEYSLRISAGLDVSNTDINRLLKKVRLLNEYQKEAPSSWIRHPEKYNFSYTGPELQYIYFVHSLCLLGRLLIYKQGRNLFPVQLKNKTDGVSITDLLVLFTQLIYYSPSYPKTALAVHTDNYSPASLVMEILQVFCDQTGSAAECLYTDAVIDALLHPVQSLLSGTEMHINCLETTLIDVADILARIAAVEDGLSLLLYGENEKTAKDDSPTAVHVIVQFTKKLLHDDISLLSGSEHLPVVKGAFIFVCRQMYRTCEGLQMLIPYGLHESIGDAWKKVNLLELWCKMFFNIKMVFWVFLQFSQLKQKIVLGFIKALVTELWTLLECGKDDLRITQPKSTPVDPIDQNCQKVRNYLIFCIGMGKSADIIDRLIILNSDAKIHSLFSYEQSHIFGLSGSDFWRVLGFVCLFFFPRDFIIDGLSVERNHVLVRINLIGGPQERILPLRVLNKGSDPYPWPMFSSFPLPKCYLAEIPRKAEFRQGTYKACKQCRCQTILAELIEKFVSHLSESRSDCYFSTGNYEAMDADMKSENLSSVQQLGVEMTVRYGKYLNLLKEHAENGLCFVLMNCEKFLKKQQRTVVSSLCCLKECYAGYDWFASSVFLIMSGDGEKTLMFLQRFSRLLVSAFLWPPRLHKSMHLPITTVESGIHPVYFCSAHHIEMLLKAELPLVFSAFHMSGFTPSQICLQWITQCFWNYMDWSEICHYIAICIFLGPDYQIYMCISVFRHLQQDILKHTKDQNLQVFLKEEALHGFRVSDYLEYMESLEAIYRPMLLKDMRSIRVQNT
uniref:Protein broad-minded n=1 Tax=Buteo japonicus TaxID=224669 RepID=A0A8B9ZDH3_9AVES